MVYMNADNNLEAAGIDDFLEMASVGSNADVDIIVQFDRVSGYDNSYDDWTTCRRFRITSGMTPANGNEIQDLGECNMADPDTLRDFITWATTNYPSPKYALVIWNHGDGWREMVEKAKKGALEEAKEVFLMREGEGPSEFALRASRRLRDLYRTAGYDETSDDFLFIPEIASAFLAAGRTFDLLGFDACLMGMVEVAYELAHSAGVMVGSEETEPGDGWPYDTILGDLVANPGWGAQQLGTCIVNRYGEFYGTAGTETMAAVDLSQVDPALYNAIDAFAQAMDTEWSHLQAARAETEEFNYREVGHIDLYHFAERVAAHCTDPGIIGAASQVMTAVGNAVIAEFHGSGHPNAHGLAIYFPERALSYEAYDRFYEDSSRYFPLCHWDEFVKDYLINTAPVIHSAWCSAPPTIDGVISPGEWDDAQEVDMGNGVTAYVMNDDHYLWIAWDDPNDNTLDAFDQVGIYFDDDHDHCWDTTSGTDEGNYWASWDGTSWVNEFRGIWYDFATYSYRFLPTVTASDLVSSGSVSSGHMQYEVRVDLTTGALQASPGDTVGFYFWCWDAGSFLPDGSWPAGLSEHYQWREPLYYGDLRLSSGAAAEFVVPYFMADTLAPDYFSALRIFNGSSGPVDVFVEVRSDDGVVSEDDVYLGSIPSGQTAYFNSATISAAVPGLSGRPFVAFFTVEGAEVQDLGLTMLAVSPEGLTTMPIYTGPVPAGSWHIKVPYFMADTLFPQYFTGMRVYNDSGSDVEIFADVRSDDGTVVANNVSLGVVPAGQVTYINSSTISAAVPGLHGKPFVATFRAAVSKDELIPVVLVISQDGFSYVPIYDADTGELLR